MVFLNWWGGVYEMEVWSSMPATHPLVSHVVFARTVFAHTAVAHAAVAR